MGKDIEQWKDAKAVSDVERWIIRMGIGYFSAAEGIVGDNIQHVVRELVTAPELKLVLGRHAHEEKRARKMGARKAKIKRRAKLARALQKRKRSMMKRKALGV